MNSKLMNKIQKAKVVSFDIFDTLILRACECPHEVFDIIESFGYKHFAVKRIAAEKEARRCAKNEDVTLDEIYVFLEAFDNIDIKNEEKRVEVEISHVNKEMLEIYKYCISENKEVIITSDMYLPIQTIKEILEKNGIVGYSRLYLSCEVGLRKKTGHLFEYIISDLNIQPKEILHIGDNHVSDNIVPMKMGIMTYEYHLLTRVLNFYQFRKYNSDALMRIRCLEDDDPYYQIGYTILGSLLYGFSIWLHKRIMENNSDKVVFLSRDGQIMKQAYELIFGKNDNNLYLYGSRRALIVPILWKTPEIEQIKTIIHFHDRMQISEFLERIGLDGYQCQEELSAIGYSRDTLIDIWQLTGDETVKKFYETIKPKMVELSKSEYKYAYDYWKENLNGASKISIVDIGWNGNMQNALITLLGNQVDIHGYYIGVNPETKYKFQMEGFLFDKSKNNGIKQKIDNFSGLFESFFMTSHGSVKRYNEDGVELLPYEYSLTDGKIVDEDQSIKKIQCGALQYLEDVKRIVGENVAYISSDKSIANTLNLGLYPSSLSCELLGDFRFYNSGIDYLARPKIKRFSIKELKQTNWRIGYLKRCFKIRLPYYQMAMMIKKMKRKSI